LERVIQYKIYSVYHQYLVHVELMRHKQENKKKTESRLALWQHDRIDFLNDWIVHTSICMEWQYGSINPWERMTACRLNHVESPRSMITGMEKLATWLSVLFWSTPVPHANLALLTGRNHKTFLEVSWTRPISKMELRVKRSPNKETGRLTATKTHLLVLYTHVHVMNSF
jgi:hypothetical protein